MRAGTCKSCKAALVWISSAKGKAIPCDAAPVYYIERPRSGKQRIVTPNGQVLACEYTGDPHKATGTGYVPHWATCPQADSYRRKNTD